MTTSSSLTLPGCRFRSITISAISIAPSNATAPRRPVRPRHPRTENGRERPAAAALLLRNSERIWLIYRHDWYTDPQRLIPAALDEELDLVDSQQFYGLQVQRYEVP